MYLGILQTDRWAEDAISEFKLRAAEIIGRSTRNDTSLYYLKWKVKVAHLSLFIYITENIHNITETLSTKVIYFYNSDII